MPTIKVIKWIAYVLVSLGAAGIFLFYVLIVAGKAPMLQELWVTTAMTTLNHKWLATAFIDTQTINNIMARTYVDDSLYATDLSGTSASPSAGQFDYTAEGYTQLDRSLYKKEVSGDLWRGYILLLSDPSRLTLAQTNQQGVAGQTVMEMTQQAGGVAGINGGGFSDGVNFNGTGGIVAGILIVEGQIISPADPNSQEIFNIIGMTDAGKLVLMYGTAAEALSVGVRNAVSFPPFLIVNGEGLISGTGGWGIAPRTAIGQRATGEILFLVIDGRQIGHSVGVDIGVLQEVLLEEQCVNAAMMDGGSSTVMVYNNEYVNKPSLGYERAINNCWVIKPSI